MGWRSILVSNPAKLSLQLQQLCLHPKEGEKVTVPLEDIASIVIESKEVIITSALLGAIANYKIILFSCDNYHMPNGCFTPFHQHSRHAQVAWVQSAWSEPFKKRLWQRLIQQKILHQSKVLDVFTKENLWIKSMIARVKSGDSENLEAQAAKFYWSKLFDNFNRYSKASDSINIALNYGYAIMRGIVARAIVTHGLLPIFGIHHKSQLNAFNLADDLIEPFRPLVDRAVKEMLTIGLLEDTGINKDTKAELISLSHSNVMFKGEEVTVLTACDKTVQSLVRAGQSKEPKDLELMDWL